MKYGDYDNVRRQILIMLRGQELTPIQANELKAVITTRTVAHVDESGPMPDVSPMEIMAAMRRNRGLDLNEG
jgi:hypothetical protein